MLSSVFRFTLTGGAATLVHLAVALLLIRFGVPPLLGNLVAFVTAFMVSFWGHHLYTFAGHGARARQALLRFMAVAGIGFLTNEAVLFLLLRLSPMPPEFAVILSTATAATSTFLLSRHWVFVAP